MFSTEKIGAIAIQTDIKELTKIYTHDKRTHTDSRPWVMLNMIASSNGLATLDGLSGKLGGEEDRALFRTLRGIADFILVGLKTVHEEKYNPPELSEAAKSLREATGKDRTPRVAVVSNSLEIDPKVTSLHLTNTPRFLSLLSRHQQQKENCFQRNMKLS